MSPHLQLDPSRSDLKLDAHLNNPLVLRVVGGLEKEGGSKWSVHQGSLAVPGRVGMITSRTDSRPD